MPDIDCSVKNGGCAHICEERVDEEDHCMCFRGYNLSENCKDCIGT